MQKDIGETSKALSPIYFSARAHFIIVRNEWANINPLRFLATKNYVRVFVAFLDANNFVCNPQKRDSTFFLTLIAWSRTGTSRYFNIICFPNSLLALHYPQIPQCDFSVVRNFRKFSNARQTIHVCNKSIKKRG